MQALIIIPVILWGCWSFFVKLATNHISGLQAQFIALIVNALAIPFFYYLYPKNQPFNFPGISWSIISALCGIGAAAVFFQVISKNGVGVSTSLAATYPLLTILLSVCFLGETFSIIKLLGSVCIVGGAFLLTR